MSGALRNPQNKKHVPNLPGWLSVCEGNYVRILNLLPDCDNEDLSYQFGAGQLRFVVQIQECTRYTSTLELCQLTPGLPTYLLPQMQVRLYHDAQMAEVLSTQNISGLQASYSYPNAAMRQKNEKELVNEFLSEWLAFCLQHADSATEC